jgi:hypothetical protein
VRESSGPGGLVRFRLAGCWRESSAKVRVVKSRCVRSVAGGNDLKSHV